MAAAVEADVSTNPAHVSLLGPVTEMAIADALANDFERAEAALLVRRFPRPPPGRVS